MALPTKRHPEGIMKTVKAILASMSLLSVLMASMPIASAQDHQSHESTAIAAGSYQVQPGDVLLVSVWREDDLRSEVIVRPDGWISLPLAGEISALGKTIDELRSEIERRLSIYISDLVVTVSAKALQGHKVYVIGKVARPGEFVLASRVDVMQALSMAGGTVRFANLENIRILRRIDGVEQVIPFNYALIEKGRGLEQNIWLEVGDVVVVP